MPRAFSDLILNRSVLATEIACLSSWKRDELWASGLPRWLRGEEFTCQCRRCRRCGLDPWVGKIPWRRKWQPTPVFLPGESHGQKNLADYSPWGHKSQTQPSDSSHTPELVELGSLQASSASAGCSGMPVLQPCTSFPATQFPRPFCFCSQKRKTLLSLITPRYWHQLM